MQYGLSCAAIIQHAPALKEKLSTLSPEARTRLETKIGTCIAKKRADLEADRAAAAAGTPTGNADAELTVAEQIFQLSTNTHNIFNTCPSPGPEEECYRDHAQEINQLHTARRPDAEVPSLFRKADRPGATVTLGLAGALAGTLVAVSRQTSVPVGGIVGALAGALAARVV